MDRQQHDRKEGRTANIGFAKWRLTCFYDSFVQGSSSVFQMNICAENPLLRRVLFVVSILKNTEIERKFKIGDLVRLKSGGVEMTVEGYATDEHYESIS